MKWAIYLIVLANIGFFVWHFQITEPNYSSAPVGRPLEEGAIRLTMLKEYVDGQNQAAAEPEHWCFSLGPFKNKTAVQQVEKTLFEQGFPTTLRASTEARKKGYWVYLPPVDSYASARATASELKDKHHIKDLFIVTTGEKKHGISLGVFSRFELAYRRQGEIRKRGYDALLEDVKLPTTEYWLDWPREFEQPLSSSTLEMAKEVGEEVSRIELACPIEK